MKRKLAWVAVLGLLAAPAVAAEEKEKELTPAEMVKLAKAIQPSLVRAELTLKYDKGQPPRAYGEPYAEGVLREERPLEIPGFLLSEKKLVISDPMIHPRFVENIAVRFADQLVKASICGYAKQEAAVFLELTEPLKQAKPLEFDPKAEGPYFMVRYALHHGTWTAQVNPLSLAMGVSERGRQYLPVAVRCLLVDKNASPVGMSMTGYLAADDSWKVSPLKWPTVTAGEMSRLLADVENRAENGLLRVRLNFRSPPKRSPMERVRFGPEEGEGSATERDVIGILTKDTEVMVLAYMGPKVTARLERITVFPRQGEPVAAKFSHTLSDYGCILAKLEKPLSGALALSDKDVVDLEDRLLMSAEVILQGEKRQSYFAHNRIGGCSLGWKRNVYPQIQGQDNNVFLFDEDGALLAFPLSRRQKVSVRETWRDRDAALTAAGQLKAVLSDLARHVDASNVPLTEEEESRLAWVGVELQGLNRELARMNKVSDLTNDGEFGALVSYVYPDSPASKAGIEVGYILIRLQVQGHPKPLEVRMGDGFAFAGQPFPWDQLDQVPEQYYDHIPSPWPPAENSFTRALTDLGFGKEYTAVFFHDGKLLNKDFKVEQSPPHYDSAARLKDKELGVTVRDLTYEVQRYFQRKPEEPGVIVSKIEPGSKASVAGIKPYEIVTHVNDQPVKDVKEFEKLIKDQPELRLAVKRMTRGRLVKIKMTPAEGEKPAATAPAAE